MEEQQLDIQFWECTKCGHRWTNRKPQKPYNCPKCRNYTGVQEAKIRTEPVKD